MTNGEKFKKVFGFAINDSSCVPPDGFFCNEDCEHCKYQNWVDEEYKDNVDEWIPVKWHEITEDEREKEGYPKEWLVFMDCVMPEDNQEILITTRYGTVEKDICCADDGYYLDSGYDFIDDVIAWKPLPEPYKEKENGNSDI